MVVQPSVQKPVAILGVSGITLETHQQLSGLLVRWTHRDVGVALAVWLISVKSLVLF